MNRTEGYYWCKIDGLWEICKCNVDEKAFERILSDFYTYEGEIDAIDEIMIERK